MFYKEDINKLDKNPEKSLLQEKPVYTGKSSQCLQI